MNRAGRTWTRLATIVHVSVTLFLTLGLLWALGCTNTLKMGSDDVRAVDAPSPGGGQEPDSGTCVLKDDPVSEAGGTQIGSCQAEIPTYVDLEVGESTIYMTADGVTHRISLVSQSLDKVNVKVDGVPSTFELDEDNCGTPGQQLPRNVSGVLVLPEITSDIQKACSELSRHRRWIMMRVSWESGNEEVDRDVDHLGYARLRLSDPALGLPYGVFPIESTEVCTEWLDAVWRPFLVRSGYGFHAGVDFYGAMGTPIIAARAGNVTAMHTSCPPGQLYPDCPPTCGNYVTVDDGIYRISYCHLTTVSESISLGKPVAAGEYLGGMGKTGWSGGSTHLHFHMVLNSGIAPINEPIRINPFPALSAWCKELTCPEASPPR